MNLHAHLFSHEIIGYNAGQLIRLDKDRTAVFLNEVYHVKPLDIPGMDRSKTVEMDPESSQNACRLAESKKQTILGWYHSHPIFEVNPSNIDIENQKVQ